MVYIARWRVKGNQPKKLAFILKKTLQEHEKHIRGAFGDKVLYYEVTTVRLE